jgi:hypothetical protein
MRGEEECANAFHWYDVAAVVEEAFLSSWKHEERNMTLNLGLGDIVRKKNRRCD